MPKFQFRFAALLKLREAARDERETKLAEAYRAEEAIEEQHEELRRQLAEVRDCYAQAAAPGEVEVDRLVQSQRYELVLKSQEQAFAEKGRLLAEEVQRRREALIEANREVRVLEKLRERQLDRHQLEEARQETKQLDEVAGRIPREI